jgi:uncharacterized damage-inducible protein DinB/MOSC domain-containing protein YiiM
MDLLDRLLGHDAWTTRQLLRLSEGLDDAQLDREFDLGLRTLRKTFLHIIRNMEGWKDVMAGEPLRPPGGGTSVPEMRTRLDRAAADLARLAKGVAKRDGWDERFKDPSGDPPTERSFGGGIAHVLTHSMHHRAQVIYMLKRLGVKGVPEGDVLSWEEQAAGELPPAPKDEGRVVLLVRRRADGVRETPARVRLSPEEGMPGDRWSRRLPRKPEAQLTVIQRDVAELVSNGQGLTVSGDNLVVDLDLSAGNLPAGTRLRVGEAVVEMSRKPHNGCSKFEARFGADALSFVQDPPTRDRNLRGVYWTVLEPGDVNVGDPIHRYGATPVRWHQPGDPH